MLQMAGAVSRTFTLVLLEAIICQKAQSSFYGVYGYKYQNGVWFAAGAPVYHDIGRLFARGR